MAVKLREETKKIQSLKTEADRQRYAEELLVESKGLLQGVIDEALRKGEELPEELREKLKESTVGRQLQIEQKMGLRDRAQARKRAEGEKERKFFEETGLRNMSKVFTMDNLVNKYQHDMAKYERKLKDMNVKDKMGPDAAAHMEE